MTAHAEQDLLLELSYGELPEREARRVRAHLAGCAECSAQLERIEGTRKLFSALPEEPAPAAGERILLAAAREAAERARPAGRLPRWLVPAAALAATVAVVSAVTLRLGPLQREDERDVLMRAPVAQAPASPEGVAAPEVVSGGSAAPADDAGPDQRAAEAMAAKPAEQPLEKKASADRDRRPTTAPRAARYAEAPAPAPPPAAAPGPARRAELADAAKAEPAPEPKARFDAGVGEADAKEESGVVGGLASAPAPATAAPSGRAAAEDEVVRSRKAAAPAKGVARADERAAAAPGAAGNGPGELAPLVRDFPGCAGETRREIGRDAGGRVVRYVREGAAGGRRVRVELRFGPDGALVSTRAWDLDSGEPLPAGALPGLPRTAAQVDADAPPRCGP